MSDLISRKKIRDYIKGEINPYGKPFEGTAYELGLKIIRYIDAMDSAYDIDKVVEELEKQRDIIFQNTDSKIRTVRANAWNKIDILNKAIEIVKQGGVSDDVCEWKQTSTAKYKTECGYKLEEYFDTKACYCKQCGKRIKVVE